MNVNNFGVLEGNLVRDPRVFTNSDGSRTVLLRVAANDNFKNRTTGKQEASFVDLKGFVPSEKDDLGVYEYLETGSPVGVGYTVRNEQYEKDGETVYCQALRVTDIALHGKAKGTSDMSD